ncbi:extracellular solute-binding protein [Cellulomonas hominis]
MSERFMGASFSRRQVLGLLGVASAAVVLPSCTSGGGGSSALASGGAIAAGRLPAYVAPPEVPGGLVSPVPGMPTIYTSTPTEFFRSVLAAPGSGGRVTSFQVLWGSPPRSVADGNRYWAELNSRLAIDFAPNLAPSGQYADKLATVLASGDVPDLTFVQDATPIGIQAIEDGAFADLTDVLAGDGILEWPNLANVGTNAWRASAKGGRLYGVPNENPYLTNFPVIRWDLVTAAGHDEVPADAEGFLTLLTDIADLRETHGKRHWALAGIDSKIQACLEWMFRAGTTWQLDDAGKLVHVIETEAFAEVMNYENRLWNGGAIHPDAFGTGLGDLFTPGQIALSSDSFSGFFGNPILEQVTNQTPSAELRFFVPPAFDGGDLVIQRDDGYWGFVAISAAAASDDTRLAELLGVLNYWRAPYGSEENLFIESGVEGFNFTIGPDGTIEPLNDDSADADRLAVQWLGAFKSPSYSIPARLDGYTENFRTTMESLIQQTVANPVVGLYSETSVRNGARLEEVHTNFRNGMIAGRIPVTDMAEYRAQWRTAGGDAMRDEYTAALESAGA